MSFSLNPMITLSPIIMVGKLHMGLNFFTSSSIACLSSPDSKSTSVNSYLTSQSDKNFFTALQWLQVLRV